MWCPGPAAVVAFCAGLWLSNPRPLQGQVAGDRLGPDCEGERCETCLHGSGTALLPRSPGRLWLPLALAINNISLSRNCPSFLSPLPGPVTPGGRKLIRGCDLGIKLKLLGLGLHAILC